MSFAKLLYFQPTLFDCTLHRQHLLSPWSGLWVGVVTQTAEKNLVNFSERLSQESQRSILSLPVWGNGIVQWLKQAWCMTIAMRYYWILIFKNLKKKVTFSSKWLLLLSRPQFKGRGCWVHWNESIKKGPLGNKKTKVQDIIVPTIDTIRYNYLMDFHVSYEVSVFQNAPCTKRAPISIKLIKTTIKALTLSFAQASTVGWTNRDWKICLREGEVDE